MGKGPVYAPYKPGFPPAFPREKPTGILLFQYGFRVSTFTETDWVESSRGMMLYGFPRFHG
jgi:hypothetical protein